MCELANTVISVYRSGDVIPKVEKVWPEFCPVDATEVELPANVPCVNR